MQEQNKIYIETYGCQMNFADSEIVASVLKNEGYEMVDNYKESDVILINTCSIREHAEDRVFKRLNELCALKKKKKHLKIGLLGCIAEHLKEKILERQPLIDIIAGPDSYKLLPQMLAQSKTGEVSIHTLLSEEETYEDIVPVRYDSNGISAFISIMRGCNNFCSYCVVPYTRGRERSRSLTTIIAEAEHLAAQGYKEITLLGQNVNSYRWKTDNQTIGFAELMRQLAEKLPNLRIRFATSHPKDLSEELIETIASHDNICKSIHLPVQSGSNDVLKRMNRIYSREDYLAKISLIRNKIPDVSISTDLIAGFCGETEADHQATLSLMKEAKFDFAFMFKYSARPGTQAFEKYPDDVAEDVKLRRLNEIIELQQQLSLQSNRSDVGKTFDVLIEGKSKRSENKWFGRNSQNKVIVFSSEDATAGVYKKVLVTDCTAATLKGKEV